MPTTLGTAGTLSARRTPGLPAALLLAIVLPQTALARADATSCVAAAERGDAAAARRSCDERTPLGAYNLALALWETDPRAARAHLDAAVDGGLAEAAHVRGNLALDAGDTEAGLADLEAAAWAGLALAQYDYATALLEHGEDGARAEAVRWYGRAAAGGEDAARYNLGVLWLTGRIGEERPLLAWAWLSSLSGLDGHPEVYRIAGELFTQMNDDERARARALLEEIERDPAAAAAGAVDDGRTS